MEKMYKSARYYFRKKPLVSTIPKERRQYSKADREILRDMDEHAKENKREKPSVGFEKYCELHPELDKDEPGLKKKYKNRHFIATK